MSARPPPPQVLASFDWVGPVLEPGDVAQAIVTAIMALNPTATVVDQGSYLRVLAAERCLVTRSAVEQALGRPFNLPGDLEIVMPSFKGTLTISEEQAVWAWRSGP